MPTDISIILLDMQTFDDIMITDAVLGEDQQKYLKEGMECEGLVHDGTVLMIELPPSWS